MSEQPLDLKSGPRIAICVLEDYHALGKRMVKSALQSAGYRPMDFGHGCRAQTVVEGRDSRQGGYPDGLLPHARVRRPRERGCGGGFVKPAATPFLVVGGAPFRLEPRLWKEVGASGHGAQFHGRRSDSARAEGEAAMEMTSGQRLELAFSHKEPDRVPYVFPAAMHPAKV